MASKPLPLATASILGQPPSVDSSARLFDNRQNIIIGCAAFLLAYALCVTLRLVEAPYWNARFFQVGGEHLMSALDAYGWMAGAEGTGRLSGQPMSDILAWLHRITGLPIAAIDFWLPAFASPLVALPLAVLCAHWRLPHLGLTAGLLAGGGYGFLFRTRLGFGDTDVFTLLLPLILSSAIILLVNPLCRAHWMPARSRITGGQAPGYAAFWLQAVVVGAVAWTYQWFYPHGKALELSIVFTGFGLSLLLSTTQSRDKLLGGLGLVFGLSLGNTWGFVLVVIGLGLARFAEPQCRRYRVGFCLLVTAVMLFLSDGHLPEITGKFQDQFASLSKVPPTRSKASTRPEAPTHSEASTRPAAPTRPKTRASIPSRFQSVQEVHNIPIQWTAHLIGMHWASFCLGLIGFFWLMLRKPMAATVLPLLAFALLSSKLGNRFAMYGGPVIGLGLGYLLDSTLQLMRWRNLARILAQLVLAGVCFGFLVNFAIDRFRPFPVLSSHYAQTLADLRSLTPNNARLWLWWDYGYAAQYYSGRSTFSDGGTQKGLFPLALAHATASPLQANQIIKLVTGAEQTTRARRKKLLPGAAQSDKRLISNSMNPIATLRRMPASDAQGIIDSLADTPRTWDEPVTPQYLVLSWENLKIARWIDHFGHWNLVTGTAPFSKITVLPAFKKVNEQGMITLRNQSIQLDGLIVISENGTTSRTWPNDSGLYGVWNEIIGQAYIMEQSIYDSMMVQMLIADPDDFEPYFELAHQRFPWTRVYKVK